MSDLMKLRDKNELSRLKTLRDEFAMAALSGMMAIKSGANKVLKAWQMMRIWQQMQC